MVLRGKKGKNIIFSTCYTEQECFLFCITKPTFATTQMDSHAMRDI